MNFEKAVAASLKFEGGYSNHPHDSGGETKYGISSKAYPDIDIPNLTVEEAKAIYKRDYWYPSGADKLSEKLAIVHFDAAINHGVTMAIRILQKIVCTPVDGKFGPKTLIAFNEELKQTGENSLIERYLRQRESVYYSLVRSISKNKVFLKGWLARLEQLRKELLG